MLGCAFEVSQNFSLLVFMEITGGVVDLCRVEGGAMQADTSFICGRVASYFDL